jgi:hypothetical protein
MRVISSSQLGVSPIGILAVVLQLNVVSVLEVGAVMTVKVTNPVDESTVATIVPPPAF